MAFNVEKNKNKKLMKCLVRLTALIGTAAAEKNKTKYSTLLEWVAENRSTCFSY